MTQPAPKPTPQPAPKPHSPERKYVQKAVNALIRWTPLGGSGWLFASFLLQQEWMLTLITFPVTVVTAVWAAYSQHFIEQLQAIYAERGKADANQLVAWLDSANEALQWQFSGFETKYLNCQRLDCQEDSPDGMRNESIFTPLLQEVFVPLRLTRDSLAPGYTEKPVLPEQGELEAMADGRVLLIWDLLRQVKQSPTLRQMAIRAWGGYGKTTLLKHVAYTYGARKHGKYRAPKLIPFLLYLSRCRARLTQAKPPNLPQLLKDYHLPSLPKGDELKLPPQWLENLLDRGEALVMFDGFDEVPQIDRVLVSEWLSQQMRQYPQAVFILTSRPIAYREDYTAKRPSASFWVDEFNDEQRRRFVEQWYFCQERYARGGRKTADVKHKAKQNAASLLAQIAERPELKAMAGNALLLNMMARFHRDKQGADLPAHKTELYQDICELQLGRRPKKKGIALLLSSLSQRQEVLQAVALAMMQRAVGDDESFKQIRRAELLALMQQPLAERDADVSPTAFLKQMVQVSELLVDKEGGIYEFAHLSFQEFLAAAELARLKQEDCLYQRLNEDAWKPTILFYGDLVNPTRLIQVALAQSATTLAYEIWRNTAKRLDLTIADQQALEALKDQVQTSRYSQLEEYLAKSQWQKADEETYRLMIVTVGKEEGQWFEPEELLNFPCEELLAIDGLWVKYSQGRFGFSVQKEIYLSPKVGGVADGRYHKKAWDRFCHQVAWKVDGAYVSVEFSTSSPQGHLPREQDGRARVSLLSHPDL